MPYNSMKEGNGTLTLNGSSQALLPERLSRQGFIITNTSATNNMWLAFQEAVSGGPGSAPTAAANTGVPLFPKTSLVLIGAEAFQGAVAILGTNTDVVTFVEI